MGKYLCTVRVLRKKLMSFVTTGLVAEVSTQNSCNILRFRPFGGNLVFDRPFEDVWPIQEKMIEMMKVRI